MIDPPGRTKSALWKRVIWVIVTGALLAAVIAIYLFLRPSPRRLADPEEFSLAAGERFLLEDLPMGGRYRLRACEHTAEVRVEIGPWTSGWSTLPVNPLDDPRRDLRIDGRNGGDMTLEARAPTGRLLVFRENMKVTCRGGDPRDMSYRARRTAEREPPFDCDESSLAGYDKQALELLRSELIEAGRRGPAGGSDAGQLSAAQQACLQLISSRVEGAPAAVPPPVPVSDAPAIAASPSPSPESAAPREDADAPLEASSPAP